MQEVHVKKRGEVYVVFLDANSRPMQLGSFNDEPAGFPQTYNSRKELEASWGTGLRFFEAPAPPERTLRKDPVTSQMVDNVLAGLDINATTKVSSPTPVPTKAPSVPVNNYLSRAQEIVKRYELAAQYANAKAKREIETKLSAIRDLIDEVFGG